MSTAFIIGICLMVLCVILLGILIFMNRQDKKFLFVSIPVLIIAIVSIIYAIIKIIFKL